MAVVPSPLHEIVERTRPVALAREQTLPVLPALEPLLPGGALQRGTTVSVGGDAATSLTLALLAGATADGSWAAVIGCPSLGLVAAAEAGVALERLVVVAEPSPESWGPVVAALVEAIDVVVIGSSHRMRSTEARRLLARARERGSVLVHLDTGLDTGPSAHRTLEADVRLTGTTTRWHGLGQGHGHLRARHVVVEAGGRRRAARPHRLALWLPGPDGAIAVAPLDTGDATVTTLHRHAPAHRRTG